MHMYPFWYAKHLDKYTKNCVYRYWQRPLVQFNSYATECWHWSELAMDSRQNHNAKTASTLLSTSYILQDTDLLTEHSDAHGNFNKCYWGGVPPTDNNKQIGQTSARSVYQQPPRVYVGIVCAGLNYYLPVHTILCRETRVRTAVALLFVSVCRTGYKKEAVRTRTHTTLRN